MNKRIYFFANFGRWDRQPYGGGEIGNRRTLAMMWRAGYEVHPIGKYNRVFKRTLPDILIIPLLMLWSFIKFSFVMLVGRRNSSLVHVVGFYGSTIYFEHLLISISHLLGYLTIYEMRGGGATDHYANGTKCYRRTFEATVRHADVIFSQGMENKPLIDSIAPGKRFFYYPNCVGQDFCPETFPVKANDSIKLLYFGRISRQKNVEVVIDTFNLLAERHSDFRLDIVGNCTEPGYAEEIRQHIKASPYASHITMHPACSHQNLKEILSDKHIYLFPTAEPREGHSNALTEAMSWGLVPIATDKGFNRTVIGNDALIVGQPSAESFAEVISRIIEKGELNDLSRESYQRVQDNYTEPIIYNRLKEEYDTLFKVEANTIP